MKVHPQDPLLFVWAVSAAGVTEKVARHITDCPRCQERARAGELLRRQGHRPPPGVRAEAKPADYSAIFDRTLARSLVHQRRLSQEKAEAPGLAARLLSLPPARRVLLFSNSRRHRTWGLCAWLVEESQKGDAALPSREEQALLALTVSRYLDTGLYGAGRVEDLRARAWGCVGRIRHLAGDLAGAESAFHAAYQHLLRGTRDGLERALLLEAKAPLLAATGRLPSSLALLKRAAHLYAAAGDLPRAGRCLVTQAVLKKTGGVGRSRRLQRRLRRFAIS